MATERMPHPSHDDEGWWEAYYDSPEFRAKVERADTDMATGRYVENATTGALEAFGRLDDDETRRLLDNPDALKQWFTARA